VSVQNLAPRVNQRAAIVAVSAIGVGVAAWLFSLPGEGYLTYESFLLLIGSIFVPLFAVFLADYHVAHRGRYGEERLFGDAPGVRPRAFLAWVLGFVVFHAFTPVGPEGWTSAVASAFRVIELKHPLFGGAVPASLVAFGVAFGAAALLSRGSRAGA
jgi:purine-cytosine permease-like protein